MTNRELEEARRRIHDYEDQAPSIDREFERLNGALRAKDQELAGWEVKYRQIATERDQLRIRTEEVGGWEIKYRQLVGERDQLNSVAHDLQNKLHQANESTRKIQEYENEISSLTQEVEKMSLALRSKVEELSRQQAILADLGKYKIRCQELEAEA